MNFQQPLYIAKRFGGTKPATVVRKDEIGDNKMIKVSKL